MRNVIEVNFNDLYKENHILRSKSNVVAVNEIFSLTSLISNMKREILLSSHATGISAIQLGVPLRIFIINMDRVENKEIIAINPQILSISGRIQERAEGCLSLPDYSGNVKRRNKISFIALDMAGEEKRYEFVGYTSAVIQHEFDHLDGILYWDRMEESQKPNKRIILTKNEMI